jgi:hypothetical protein
MTACGMNNCSLITITVIEALSLQTVPVQRGLGTTGALSNRYHGLTNDLQVVLRSRNAWFFLIHIFNFKPDKKDTGKR